MRRAFFATVLLAITGLPSGVNGQTGQEQQILLMTKDRWVGFRDYNGQQLIYFTHLEAWRCGISSVRYSVNSTALDQEWRLQPCDPDNPNAVTTDKPYISLPLNSAQSISVQLTFSGGAVSEVETYAP